MKQKSIITLVVILAIAGAISYGIIWYRKRASTPSTGSGTNSGTPSINSGTNSGSGYQLPAIQTYAWWINKLGHAKFPLGMASVGVEVLKVQEVLNDLAISKKLNAAAIEEDGKWGFNTDSRFKLLFPKYNMVMLSQYITDFDPNKETLK